MENCAYLRKNPGYAPGNRTDIYAFAISSQGLLSFSKERDDPGNEAAIRRSPRYESIQMRLYVDLM